MLKWFTKKKSLKRKKKHKHTEIARALVHSRLEYFNQVYIFSYNRVAIREQKTRWGSCSSKGNLNFNVRIAVLPMHLVDYIVVHELCHLGEFNHSKAFWDLVEKAYPMWREARKELATISLRR